MYCQYLIPLSSSLRNNNIVTDLVDGDNNIFVMEIGVLATFRSLKIYVDRLLIDPFSPLILICISDLTLFTQSERVCKSSFGEHISRGVVDNVKDTSYNVISRIIYGRLTLEIINIEILQHLLVVTYYCSIGITDIVHSCRRRRGRDCMVAGFTTTYAISAYQH